MPTPKPTPLEQQRAIDEHYRLQGLNDSPIMDEDDAAREKYRREAKDLLRGFEERFITPLIEFHALPTDCLIFANGYGHIIQCYCQKDIVKRHEAAPNAKANVSKYVKQFTRRITLPSSNGQRDEQACTVMRRARIGQLTIPNETEP